MVSSVSAINGNDYSLGWMRMRYALGVAQARASASRGANASVPVQPVDPVRALGKNVPLKVPVLLPETSIPTQSALNNSSEMLTRMRISYPEGQQFNAESFWNANAGTAEEPAPALSAAQETQSELPPPADAAAYSGNLLEASDLSPESVGNLLEAPDAAEAAPKSAASLTEAAAQSQENNSVPIGTEATGEPQDNGSVPAGAEATDEPQENSGVLTGTAAAPETQQAAGQPALSPEGVLPAAAAEGRETVVEALASEDGVEKTPAEAMEDGKCETCEKRKYQDGSDDPGVSFKSPTQLNPQQAATAVRMHEQEHVVREQAKAEREGRKVVSQSVTINTDICPECGKPYVSGGVTRTVTAPEDPEEGSAPETSQISFSAA